MRKNLIVLVLWTLVIFGVLLAPIGGVEQSQFGGFSHWDKIGHIILFGITGFVCAYSASYFKTITSRILFGFIFSVSLALLTEGLQRFVARDSDFCDLLADTSGLLLGLLVYVLLELRRKSQHTLN
jgi:VanZ family protein